MIASRPTQARGRPPTLSTSKARPVSTMRTKRKPRRFGQQPGAQALEGVAGQRRLVDQSVRQAAGAELACFVHRSHEVDIMPSGRSASRTRLRTSRRAASASTWWPAQRLREAAGTAPSREPRLPARQARSQRGRELQRQSRCGRGRRGAAGRAPARRAVCCSRQPGHGVQRCHRFPNGGNAGGGLGSSAAAVVEAAVQLPPCAGQAEALTVRSMRLQACSKLQSSTACSSAKSRVASLRTSPAASSCRISMPRAPISRARWRTASRSSAVRSSLSCDQRHPARGQARHLLRHDGGAARALDLVAQGAQVAAADAAGGGQGARRARLRSTARRRLRCRVAPAGSAGRRIGARRPASGVPAGSDRSHDELLPAAGHLRTHRGSVPRGCGNAPGRIATAGPAWARRARPRHPASRGARAERGGDYVTAPPGR